MAVLEMNGNQSLHRAMAAADFVLWAAQRSAMQSSHLFAQRYGAVPVARATGVFADSLVDCDAQFDTGNSFLFESLTVEDLKGAAARAVTAFGNATFERLRRRVMRQDLGWERPARRVVQVYRQVLGIRL
jgi:starch synthase